MTHEERAEDIIARWEYCGQPECEAPILKAEFAAVAAEERTRIAGIVRRRANNYASRAASVPLLENPQMYNAVAEELRVLADRIESNADGDTP